MDEKNEHPVKKPCRSFLPSDTTSGAPSTEVHHEPLRAPPPVKHPQSSKHNHQTRSPSNPFSERHGSRRASQDPEKASFDHRPMPSHHRNSRHPSVAYFEEDHEEPDEDEEDDPKRHVVWILVYLSALAPLLALPVALYTLFATLLLLLLSPSFLILKRPLGIRLYKSVAPPREFQLGLIFSSYETNSTPYHSTTSIVVLIFVNILAPVYAMIIAMAAWVGGVFWFYTAILGNPDGNEERDDGREAVLTVRGWWEKWLVQGLA